MIKKLKQFAYLCSGFFGRLGGKITCPSCGSSLFEVVDRKYFHQLNECGSCHLLYRYPVESDSRMSSFYQRDYAEPGYTTELPDDKALEHLLNSRFLGSAMDCSYQQSLLESLGLRPGMKLLDYGANWGYMTWQFKSAGYDVTAYEISEQRARFGKKLGIEIHTSITTVGKDFDMVYSGHVLEHVPDPAATLKEQLSLVKPGGLVAAHTPNGSRSYREQYIKPFHRSWGQVHPVLLTDDFVAHVAGQRAFLVASNDAPERLLKWDHSSQQRYETSETGFFFVVRKE